MPEIFKFSQKLVLTQLVVHFVPQLETRMNMLSINGTFSINVIYGDLCFCLGNVDYITQTWKEG